MNCGRERRRMKGHRLMKQDEVEDAYERLRTKSKGDKDMRTCAHAMGSLTSS